MQKIFNQSIVEKKGASGAGAGKVNASESFFIEVKLCRLEIN
jgi:hypothetical protein